MIEKMIIETPVVADGDFEFKGSRYPILRSQPIPPLISWDVTPHDAEVGVTVYLSDLGSGVFVFTLHIVFQNVTLSQPIGPMSRNRSTTLERLRCVRPRISFVPSVARKSIFGLLGAWYVGTTLR